MRSFATWVNLTAEEVKFHLVLWQFIYSEYGLRFSMHSAKGFNECEWLGFSSEQYLFWDMDGFVPEFTMPAALQGGTNRFGEQLPERVRRACTFFTQRWQKNPGDLDNAGRRITEIAEEWYAFQATAVTVAPHLFGSRARLPD